tara:strand:+ start:1314 stop:2021 length:708 start_codon:yes stop_codon:yes gene_type:complete
MKFDLYNDNVGSVEYVEHMGSDLTIVNSARVSFGKQKMTLDTRDEKLIKYLMEHKHTSTLEHNIVTFRFCVPLFVRSQHHRHRTWSYNEISRRYTEVDIRFYEPPEFRTQHKSNRQASNIEDTIDPIIYAFEDGGKLKASSLIKRHHEHSLELFNSLLDSGICREQARGVLPQNMYTEYYGTVNLNNLLKFIELRTHMGAQWEIQKVAKACLEIASNLWPITMKAYREMCSVEKS